MPHDAQASSPPSLLIGASSSSLAALAAALLLRLVELAFFFVGLSPLASLVSAASVPLSALDLTSHDVEPVWRLTGLALATTSLLLAGRSDRSSAFVSGILRRGLSAGSVLVVGDLVQQAADACPGARDIAEFSKAGELLHVDLSARVSDLVCDQLHRTLASAYLWLSLQAAVVDAKLLHLAVGKRAGGCFRGHGGGCYVGEGMPVPIVGGKD